MDDVRALSEVNCRISSLMETVLQPRVLEAGCGRRTHVEVGPGAYIVGIDISADEISRNERVDEALVGDIQSYSFEPESFDVSICWNVLEHLPHPTSALDNIRAALRPGGLIVIGVPNLRSLKTFVVKLTPGWLHRFIWHQLYPAAEPDHNPFPTVFSPAMSVAGLNEYAQAHAMETVQCATYESAMQRKLRGHLKIADKAWQTFSRVLRRLTGGRLDAWNSDVVVILRRLPG